ncbi:MAG: hypothetical protein DWQ34_15415 [Planctomycetota bacterium]|nr:MAG: hypothetical protein DWQ34_15415 [Planctomycetota bacterium]REJ91278.1 MAG: hypothetical protein DWQ29_05850 [Planctomycetota bacterium]REK28898.1 MAG: hypothetical protein DWQ41_04925 [Planctomycetota bacterium]REK39668.1 MAG: hypothetical protein DWQ45_02020 [Planctomycetota bacterium]
MKEERTDSEAEQTDEPHPQLPRRRAGPTEEDEETSEGSGSGRDAYNVVSDTVVGVNFRFSDNCFQAVFIFVSLLLGVGIGALFAIPEGLLIGGLVGLIGGLILSGAVLMVYRGIRHLRGKHD